MTYISPVSMLCYELNDYIGSNVTQRNYNKVATLDQYVEFCKDHWEQLKDIHPDLIDSYEIDEAIKDQRLGKWDFYCLILGIQNRRLEK